MRERSTTTPSPPAGSSPEHGVVIAQTQKSSPVAASAGIQPQQETCGTQDSPVSAQSVPSDGEHEQSEPEEDDGDSAFDEGSILSETSSLSEDITRYRYEHNRRYHAFRAGEYWGPNDEKQNNQLDIAHHLYLLTLEGNLFLAPIGERPQKVLDVGNQPIFLSLP